MGHARSRKIKTTPLTDQTGAVTPDVFWMSLEEAKKAISDKYEFLADKYERKYGKNKA